MLVIGFFAQIGAGLLIACYGGGVGGRRWGPVHALRSAAEEGKEMDQGGQKSLICERVANHLQPIFSLETRTISIFGFILRTAADGAYEYG